MRVFLEEPFIARCCRSEREGAKSWNGRAGAVVHWGANPVKIYEAVRDLVSCRRAQMTTIAIVEGDGIGHEVIPVARQVLEVLHPEYEYFAVDVGLRPVGTDRLPVHGSGYC